MPSTMGQVQDTKKGRQITKQKKKTEQHTWYSQIQNNRHRLFRYQPLSNSTSFRILIRSNSRCIKAWSLLSVYLPIYISTLTVIWIWPIFESCLIDWDKRGWQKKIIYRASWSYLRFLGTYHSASESRTKWLVAYINSVPLTSASLTKKKKKREILTEHSLYMYSLSYSSHSNSSKIPSHSHINNHA